MKRWRSDHGCLTRLGARVYLLHICSPTKHLERSVSIKLGAENAAPLPVPFCRVNYIRKVFPVQLVTCNKVAVKFPFAGIVSRNVPLRDFHHDTTNAMC